MCECRWNRCPPQGQSGQSGSDMAEETDEIFGCPLGILTARVTSKAPVFWHSRCACPAMKTLTRR